MKTFETKAELKLFLDMKLPFAEYAERSAYTEMISLWSSNQARNVCIDALVESFFG